MQRNQIVALLTLTLILQMPFCASAAKQKLVLPEGLRGSVVTIPESPPVSPPFIVGESVSPVRGSICKTTKAALYSIGEPTAKEQLLLEYINRARADANAEAQRLKDTTDSDVLGAYSYFSVDLDQMVSQFATLAQKLPPLSMNSNLLALARLHSQDMLQNVFQGHSSSSNPPSPLLANGDLSTRFNTIGYDYSYAAENVYAYADSPYYAHAGFEVDWGTGAYGMQDPPGHRDNIHSASLREAGIGVIEGSNSNGSDTVGPLLVTQDFGDQHGASPFITGVVYKDVNTNLFYDEGEGIGGVTVTVHNASYYAVSAGSGGYSVPVSGSGAYTVTFSGSNIYSSVTAVITNTENVKVDYIISGTNTTGSGVSTSTNTAALPKDDLAVYDSTSGYWYILGVDGSLIAWAMGWGWPGAETVPGDYNGDGVSDLAVFDQNSGAWYVYSLDGTVLVWGTAWGWSGAVPVSGDYNGDGKDDLAVYDSTSGYWYILGVDGSLIAWAMGWGWPGAETVPGDYNGDGVSDLAVFDQNSGAWYVYSIDGTVLVWGTAWGWSGAVPVSGDYNGDGKDDLAVYDSTSGYWYILGTDGSLIAWAMGWGWPGAETVPGDYNGDGVSDLAVFDQNSGAWYVYSLDGTVLVWGTAWGWSGAVPVPGNYQ